MSTPDAIRQPIEGAAGMAERSKRRTLPRPAAFWILAGMFLVLFFASAAASPLYGVYQAQFHFSAATLTAVFAVYVLVLLITLLIFGSVSDYLGRIPVITTALVFSVAARRPWRRMRRAPSAPGRCCWSAACSWSRAWR
jgi:MFS family permease